MKRCGGGEWTVGVHRLRYTGPGWGGWTVGEAEGVILPVTRCRFAHGVLELWSASVRLELRGWPAPVARDLGSKPRVVCPTFRVLSPRRWPLGVPEAQHAFPFFDPPQPRQTLPTPTPLQSALRREGFPWLVLRRAAFEQFRATIPDPVAEVVAPFRRGQWALLVFLRYEPLGVELLRSSPGLAYLVALRGRGLPRRIPKLELALRKRRALVSELLGLPDREAVVRRLSRFTIGALGCFAPRVLTDLLRRDDPRLEKLIGHLPSINPGAVAVLRHPRWWPRLTPGLLQELAADPREARRPRAARLLEDYGALRQLLPRLPPLGPISRVAQLEEALQEARQRLGRVDAQLRWLEPVDRHRFPPPPFPGIRGRIEPISTPAALAEESLLQRNCVDGYVERVTRGGCYLYRVLRPSRATLCVTLDSHGQWQLEELKLRGNRPAPRRLEALIRRWLDLALAGPSSGRGGNDAGT